MLSLQILTKACHMQTPATPRPSEEIIADISAQLAITHNGYPVDMCPAQHAAACTLPFRTLRTASLL